MSEKRPNEQADEYRCPGERQAISRAVHLGRMAAFYPPCRRCPHREDAGSLSPRQVEQLAETAARRRPRPLFHDEGAAGVFLDEFTPADARRMAAAFGAVVREETEGSNSEERREKREEGGNDGGEQREPSIHPSSFIPHPSAILHPSVVLAGDGRPISAELVAAVADGLRWSGCDVIDIGPATAACLAFAIHHIASPEGDRSMFSDQRLGSANEQLGDCPNFRPTKMGLSPSGRRKMDLSPLSRKRSAASRSAIAARRPTRSVCNSGRPGRSRSQPAADWKRFRNCSSPT